MKKVKYILFSFVLISCIIFSSFSSFAFNPDDIFWTNSNVYFKVSNVNSPSYFDNELNPFKNLNLFDSYHKYYLIINSSDLTSFLNSSFNFDIGQTFGNYYLIWLGDDSYYTVYADNHSNVNRNVIDIGGYSFGFINNSGLYSELNLRDTEYSNFVFHLYNESSLNGSLSPIFGYIYSNLDGFKFYKDISGLNEYLPLIGVVLVGFIAFQPFRKGFKKRSIK